MHNQCAYISFNNVIRLLVISMLEHYGYSYDEFMNMTILNIRPEEFWEEVKNAVTSAAKVKKFVFQGLFTHLKKNGQQIRVSIQSAPTIYSGKRAKLVIAYDMTEQENYIRAIEAQNAKLKQLSWMQSHVFRAPISKIMGLAELAKLTEEGKEDELRVILNYISDAATEIDTAILQATLAAKAE